MICRPFKKTRSTKQIHISLGILEIQGKRFLKIVQLCFEYTFAMQIRLVIIIKGSNCVLV